LKSFTPWHSPALYLVWQCFCDKTAAYCN